MLVNFSNAFLLTMRRSMFEAKFGILIGQLKRKPNPKVVKKMSTSCHKLIKNLKGQTNFSLVIILLVLHVEPLPLGKVFD